MIVCLFDWLFHHRTPVDRVLTLPPFPALWDLFMDFSLVQPNARHRWLRDILSLKQRWLYYLVLVIDPILRFGWIPYVAMTAELQHSSIVSFCVGLAEVFRRAIWALLRVENEHCANMAQYKASRDVPLPYRLELFAEEPESPRVATSEPQAEPSHEATPRLSAHHPSPAASTPKSRARAKSTAAQSIVGVPLDNATATISSSDTDSEPDTSPLEASRTTESRVSAHEGRKRPVAGGHKRTISRILAEAHRQDFVKKKKPEHEAETAHEETRDREDDGNGVGLTRRNTAGSVGGLGVVREETRDV